MKIHIITKLARQVEGEHIFINALAAFTDRVKAEEFLKNLSYEKAEVVAGTECLIEMGILYDLEVTE